MTALLIVAFLAVLFFPGIARGCAVVFLLLVLALFALTLSIHSSQIYCGDHPSAPQCQPHHR